MSLRVEDSAHLRRNLVLCLDDNLLDEQEGNMTNLHELSRVLEKAPSTTARQLVLRSQGPLAQSVNRNTRITGDEPDDLRHRKFLAKRNCVPPPGLPLGQMW
jgi:hypothetical protein